MFAIRVRDVLLKILPDMPEMRRMTSLAGACSEDSRIIPIFDDDDWNILLTILRRISGENADVVMGILQLLELAQYIYRRSR